MVTEHGVRRPSGDAQMSWEDLSGRHERARHASSSSVRSTGYPQVYGSAAPV